MQVLLRIKNSYTYLSYYRFRYTSIWNTAERCIRVYSLMISFLEQSSDDALLCSDDIGCQSQSSLAYRFVDIHSLREP